mmetsp:Transcript_51716/g.154545  ORF Transcript_51716/g.154545 Transcript_51716/m.154545 type:complete len:214 (+) Transcript_51716:256-897(+)
MARKPAGGQQAHEEPLQDVDGHGVADLRTQLALGHRLLERLRAHPLQAHHLCRRHPPHPVGDPVAGCAGAGQAGRQVPVVLHPAAGAVAINDPGLPQRVVAFLPDLLERPPHVRERRGLLLGGQGGLRDAGRPRLQEQLDAGPLHRLGEREGAVVPPPEDADKVDAAAALRKAVVLCVEELRVDVVGPQRLQGLDDGIVVLPIAYPHQTSDVL